MLQSNWFIAASFEMYNRTSYFVRIDVKCKVICNVAVISEFILYCIIAQISEENRN